MAYNEQLTNRVREALMHLPDVEEKKMFRGVAFMVNGKMCVTVGDDEIMCRIDPARHAAAIARDGCSTKVMKGREYIGYVVVEAQAIRTQNDLDSWVALALEFNDRAKASPKKKKKTD